MLTCSEVRHSYPRSYQSLTAAAVTRRLVAVQVVD